MIECESIMADKDLIYMVKSIGPSVIAALDNTLSKYFIMMLITFMHLQQNGKTMNIIILLTRRSEE